MEVNAGSVRPFDSISRGWEIIGNNYMMYVLMTLVFFVILIAASMIVGLISNGISFAIAAVLGVASQNTGSVGEASATIATQVISMIVSLFTNIITITLSGTLMTGIYSAMSRTATDGSVEFGDLFSGFQKIQPNLIVACVLTVLQFAVSLILLLFGLAFGVSVFGLREMILKDGQPNPEVLGGLLAVIFGFVGIYLVINLIISVFTTFVYPLIAERNVSGIEALTNSARGGMSNFIGILLLLILLGLMALGGALLCLIGLLFVTPVIYAAVFAAYRDVYGAPQNRYGQTPPPPPTFGNQPAY